MEFNFDEIIERRNTGSVKYDLCREYFGTSDLIPMWVADMDFRTPPFIMEAIRERAAHEILGYSIRSGGFYDSIMGWYARRQNWTIRKEWILFSPGVVPALHFAVRAFTDPGDRVIVQPPVYHPFSHVVRGNRRRVLNNQLIEKDGVYRMDAVGLKKQLGPDVKLILLSHPHNPVGRVWSGEELLELAEVCLQNNIIMLSDEIHSDLVFPGSVHVPLSCLSDEIASRTITCVAPSKTFNVAGLASSAVIIPDDKLRKKFSSELETGHLGMGNIFGNAALQAAYNMGDKWLDELLAYLAGNLDLMTEFIGNEIPEIGMTKPQATYLAWLDMRKLNLEGKALREFMIRKAGLGLNDGPVFGQGGEGFQRLNFGCPRVMLRKALVQLRDAVRAL